MSYDGSGKPGNGVWSTSHESEWDVVRRRPSNKTDRLQREPPRGWNRNAIATNPVQHQLDAKRHQQSSGAVKTARAKAEHQMNAAKFPAHRDLAGFDFASSSVDQPLVKQLATMAFTDTSQNAVFIGGPGTGKTHLVTAIGVSGIALQGKRVRFYSTVDLVNVLEREKRDGKAGRLPAQQYGREVAHQIAEAETQGW